VAFVCMLPFDFTGSRKSESFFGAGFGLHFWHVTGFDDYKCVHCAKTGLKPVFT